MWPWFEHGRGPYKGQRESFHNLRSVIRDRKIQVASLARKPVQAVELSSKTYLAFTTKKDAFRNLCKERFCSWGSDIRIFQAWPDLTVSVEMRYGALIRGRAFDLERPVGYNEHEN